MNEEMKELYKNMPDQKFNDIDPSGLTEEGKLVYNEELKRRSTDEYKESQRLEEEEIIEEEPTKKSFISKALPFLGFLAIWLLIKYGAGLNEEKENVEMQKIQQQVEQSINQNLVDEVNNALFSIQTRHQSVEQLLQTLIKDVNGEKLTMSESTTLMVDPEMKKAIMPKEKFGVIANKYREIIAEYERIETMEKDNPGIELSPEFSTNKNAAEEGLKYALDAINQLKF